MFGFLRKWLRESPHVHLRERRVANFRNLVDLIDRFIDDELDYGLEWDDFVSWTNENPSVETMRGKIASLEPMFFSKDESVVQDAIRLLLEYRNHAAALAGCQAREAPKDAL